LKFCKESRFIFLVIFLVIFSVIFLVKFLVKKIILDFYISSVINLSSYLEIKKDNKTMKNKIQIQIMYHYNYDGEKVYDWEAMSEEFEEELSKLDESVIVMCSVEAKENE